MKRAFLVFWLLVPVAFAAWHFGPGQRRLALDDVARHAAEGAAHAAHAAALADDEAPSAWARAEAAYDAALAALPAGERETAIRLRLERAKARMHVSRLPEAHDELRALADDVLLEPVDPELDADVRRTLAQARFFMTWLMRLEGAPREEWEPEIEAARQGLKALAEEARAAGDAERLVRERGELEATIELARMDLAELQGLPLPSQ